MPAALEGAGLGPSRPDCGAELPAVLRTPVPATWMGGPGETADFEVTPSRPGDYLLQVRTESSGWSIMIPVTVKAAAVR